MQRETRNGVPCVVLTANQWERMETARRAMLRELRRSAGQLESLAKMVDSPGLSENAAEVARLARVAITLEESL